MNIESVVSFFKQAAVGKIVDLKEHAKDNPDIYQQIEEIERRQFDKYQDFPYAQSRDDIEDDHSQPGIISYGILDEGGHIQGYVTGYNFTLEEDFDPNAPDIHWYNRIPVSEVERAAEQSEIFYIANMAVEQSYRENVPRLMRSMVNTIIGNGYKYVAFAALSDSYRLMFDDAGNPRTAILRRFGLQPIGRKQEDDQMIVLLKIIS